ncbi:MAG: nicotinamide-nucleotide amidohydrolase family protein [Pseudomonadota bacterium]
MLALAESCTGGMIAARLTDIPGSSAVVERGFVTYSNAAKTDLLGVPAALIDAHGAVSEPVARAMAEGALRGARASAADVGLALSVTGIAGPGGGTAEKPEGRVHFAAAAPGVETRHVMRDFGALGRAAVREASVAQALRIGLQMLGPAP